MSNKGAEYVISLKDQFTGPANSLEQSVERLEKALERLGVDIKAVTQATREQSNNTDRLKNSFKGVKAEADSAGRSINSLKAGTISIGALEDKVLSLKTALVGAGAVAFGKSVIDATAEYESLGVAIKQSSGGALEGAKSLQFLTDTAEELGLDVASLRDGFRTFAGGMIGTGITIGKTRQYYKEVATAVSAMGLSGDDAKGVFLALGQIMGKGKVQAEELRGQIGERIPGAFATASRAMGVTQAQLNKMLDNGLLNSKDFISKFTGELYRGNVAGAREASKGLRANLNRLSSEWVRFKEGIGRELYPALTGILKLLREKISLLKSAFHWVKEHWGAISGLAKVLFYAWGAIKLYNIGMIAYNTYTSIATVLTGVRLVAALTGATSAQVLLNGAMRVMATTNPWGLALVGVGLLIAGVYKLINAKKELQAQDDNYREGVLFKTLRQGQKDQVESKAVAGIKQGLTREQALSQAVSKEGATLTGAEQGLEEDLRAGRVNDKQYKLLREELDQKRSVLEGYGYSSSGYGSAPGAPDANKTKVESPEAKVSGKGVTHLTINIGKLVEDLNISTTNIQETATRIREEVAKALLSAVNDANITAGR